MQNVICPTKKNFSAEAGFKPAFTDDWTDSLVHLAKLTDTLSNKKLALIKDLLEKFHWALKEGDTGRALDITIQYLSQLDTFFFVFFSLPEI